MPETDPPQYTYHHYKYSVLLDSKKPIGSPKFDLGLSILRMEYPEKQAAYINEFFYPGATVEEFRDRTFVEQRDNYRKKAAAAGNAGLYYNWRYSDSAKVIRSHPQGIIIERNFITYSGGEYPAENRRFYVFDMEEFRQIKIDDLFANFHEELQLRDLVYDELRKYGSVDWGQPLSEGIFLINEPELSFNFYFTDDGLVLHWDPAQIAPYDEGEIEIILVWQVIQPLMLYPGVELLTKFNIHPFSYVEEGETEPQP